MPKARDAREAGKLAKAAAKPAGGLQAALSDADKLKAVEAVMLPKVKEGDALEAAGDIAGALALSEAGLTAAQPGVHGVHLHPVGLFLPTPHAALQGSPRPLPPSAA